jgi:hypothetical protein
MEQITKIRIFDVKGNSLDFYTQYPFNVNEGDFFKLTSFIDEDLLSSLNEDECSILDDCCVVSYINHKIINNCYCREITFIYDNAGSLFSNYITEIKDGKIFTHSNT